MNENIATVPAEDTAAQVKVDQKKVWEDYEKGRQYNESIGLYEAVQQCEDFYIGDQWKNCKAGDLDLPVINILKRVVNFFVSNLVSDDIGIHLEKFPDIDGDKPTMDMLETQLDKIMEQTALKKLLRRFLRDAAVKGDGCVHLYFDVEDTDSVVEGDTPGAIKAERVPNYRVLFGNPQIAEVEAQPWVIIEYRKTLQQVREEAKEAGIAEWESIQPDEGEKGINTEHEHGKVTVLRRYWREKSTKTIWAMDICKQCILSPAHDTGYSLYPVVWMPWEEVENSYHGMSAVKALIPNQIFINKEYAMAMQHVKLLAFPKIAYNKAMLPNGYSNRVGEAIPVNGDPNMAVAQGIKAPDMSGQVMAMIQQTISDTRDTMGASDASLGNVKPDNTSAIIATQKATSMPLELNRLAFNDSVENIVRICLDMMGVCYGVRQVIMSVEVPGEPSIDPMTGAMVPGEPQEVRQPVAFDFGTVKGLGLQLNVDIGESSYWSEIMQVQTLDSLVAHGIINDPVAYLDAIPDGYIKNKAELLKSVKKSMGMAAPAPGGMTPGGVPTPQGVSLPASMGGLGSKMTTSLPIT